MKRLWPALVVLLLGSAFTDFRLAQHGGDAAALAEIGTRFSEARPEGSEGYDGQFALYVAQEPDPAAVAPKLDEPAYRYQRILYPMLARLVGLGREEWIPWTLLVVNLLAHAAATFALSLYLLEHDTWPGYALLYGLWAGVFGGVALDLHEPLAYGLAAVGVWARQRGQPRWSAASLSLALFAKESTIVFLLAAVMADLWQGRWRRTALNHGPGVLAFALWQLWLWATFGEPGLASGGAQATPFELIPFMGLLRVGLVDPRVLGVYLLIFGPGIILPALWGLLQSGRDLLQGHGEIITWALLLNALIIVFLPHSTFREPFGMVRLASGLVLSVVVYASARGFKRLLIYGWFGVAYLALLF